MRKTLLTLILVTVIFFPVSSVAADKVVVIPLNSNSVSGVDGQIQYNDGGSEAASEIYYRKLTGNVGINTTSPGARLSIMDGSAMYLHLGAHLPGLINDNPSIALSRWTGVANEYNSHYLATVYDAPTGGYGLAFNTTVGAHSLGDFDDTGTPLTRMFVGYNGNVGIGTTSPGAKLHVENGSILVNAFSNEETGIFFREGMVSSPYKYNQSILSYNHDGANADGLSINGWDGISFSTGANTRNERMRIDYYGNVGIGVTTPASKLTIGNNVSSGGPDGAFSSYQILLYDTGDANSSFGLGIEGGNFWFNTATGYKFYSGGSLVASIDSAGAYTQISDRRLKSNIKILNNSLNKITSLRGVSYIFNNHKGQGSEIGIIAQEVNELYPELVSRNKKTGYLSINYSGLVAPLIEAVKELKTEKDKEISELQLQNDELQEKFNKLSKRLASVEVLLKNLAIGD